MSWLGTLRLDAPGQRIGPGCLVLVVGPSGAGKDTLIARARAACRDDQGIVFPRRVVTRPVSACEEHDTLSALEFDAAMTAGAFALSWSAHGLRYGIPASIESELRAGRTVVCNASRTIVDGARARYRHVKVVLVTAPPDVLEARLTRRARSSDGAVTERLQRAVSADRDVDPDIIIDNIGAIESGVRRLLNAIHDQTSFVAF
jgi:ribose 1,5-bisphosphokinase